VIAFTGTATGKTDDEDSIGISHEVDKPVAGIQFVVLHLFYSADGQPVCWAILVLAHRHPRWQTLPRHPLTSTFAMKHERVSPALHSIISLGTYCRYHHRAESFYVKRLEEVRLSAAE
jgi:hypothetical protein